MPNNSQQARKWYKSKRWQRLRQKKLQAQPYCQCPHHKGKAIPADTVDHIKPHKGDARLFWDTRNLQSMTKQCHDRFKQSQEKGGHGFLQGFDENGNPLSHSHHWFQG